MAHPKILIVEDKKSIAETVETRLKELGYTVCAVVSTGAEAVEKAAELHPDIVLIDLELEGEINGIEAAERIRNSLDIPTVYLADYSNPVFLTKEDLLKRAEITNPFEYLPFPYGGRKLYLVIESVLYKHRMEKESKAYKQHRTMILGGISDAVIATDNKGFLTFMNPVAETLTGWEMEEVSGKHVTDMFNIHIGNGGNLIKDTFLIETIQKGAIPTGGLSSASEVDYNTYLIAKSGREIPIDYNITSIKDEQENPTGIVITFRDITKYRTKEEALNQTIGELDQQTNLMKTVFDSMYDGIVVIDLRGRVLFVNPSIQQMVGTEPPGSPPSRWAKQYGVFYPDQETPFPMDQILSTQIARGEAVRDQALFIRNKEQPEGIHIRASAVPLYDENQEVVACVCIIRDVTKDKIAAIQLEQTMQELQNQARLTGTIFNNIGDGVIAADASGSFTIFNPSAERILGIGPINTTPDKWSDNYGFFFPDRVTPFPADELPLARALKGEASDEVEMFVRNPEVPDGVFISVSGRPLQDEAGTEKGGVSVFRDVTHRVIAEEALTQAFAQGRLEIVEPLLHNSRNAINSVTAGTDVLEKDIVDNQLIHPFDEIVGKSKNMRQMFALMQRAAESDITVLISGESGTGKELVARAIHANSPRKEGPFITVNCAAIPETLIESELFGHEQGAFTGATTKRIGKFEHANQGTIFFDEIGDMQWVLQAKLLRVLQERQIQRVGGTTNIPLDIQVLTATNQDLEAAVEAGTFRTDLFYRIAAFPIKVPPLRDRREDIPLLAHHFLQKYAEKVPKSIKAISANALQLLMQYDFPGNVRELENSIERAVVLETTELLQPSNLPTQILAMMSSPLLLSSANPTGILPFEEFEREMLAHTLKIMDNNVTKAAQALKMSRSTLYRKLKLHQLPVSD